MNKKGFTLVELITTFALTAVIVTILINVSVVIRNMYNKAQIKTQLLIEQANLSNALNTKINKKMLEDYSTCTDSSFCYNFVFSDGSTEKLIVTNSSIKFGNYVYKIQNGTEIKNPSLSKAEVSPDSSNSEFLVLKIPIVNKLYPDDDFGINLVYQYNLNYVSRTARIVKPVTLSNKSLAGNIPQGNFALGDEYIVDVDGEHKYHFYVLSTEGNKVNLILNGNICSDGTLATAENTCLVAWYSNGQNNSYGPTTAIDYLHQATKNWSNIENIQMNYTDEGNTGSYGYKNISTFNNKTMITNKDNSSSVAYDNLKARLPKFSEIIGTGCNISTSGNGSCPVWMVNGLKAYTDKYPTGTKEDIEGIFGYWSLSSSPSLSYSARNVNWNGNTDSGNVTYTAGSGIRPVITISKTYFPQ